MDNRSTQTIARQPNLTSIEDYDESRDAVERRLNLLLEMNLATALEKSLFASETEKFEAKLIKNPLTFERAHSYFGLLLGVLPPAAIFTRFMINSGMDDGDFWIVGVMAIVCLISGVVGYFSGNVVGKMVREIQKLSWFNMMFLLPFIGILWGIVAGGAGGIIIFVVGAIFGAGLGALVGGAALPVYAAFHRLLKKGDLIERNQFLPIAFGITLAICGLILGF